MCELYRVTEFLLRIVVVPLRGPVILFHTYSCIFRHLHIHIVQLANQVCLAKHSDETITAKSFNLQHQISDPKGVAGYLILMV
jgi:hypothetical protein